MLLKVLTDLSVIGLLRVVSLIIDPLRTAQVALQSSGNVLATFTQFQAAYAQLATMVASEQAFKAAVADQKKFTIDKAVPPAAVVQLKADVTFLASGAILVSELSDEPLWTTVYGSGSSAGIAAWLKVVEAARAPVMVAANKWTKVGENALQTVELRAIGAGLFAWRRWTSPCRSATTTRCRRSGASRARARLRRP